MPETVEPPIAPPAKGGFASKLAATRPSTKEELESGVITPPTPNAPPSTPAAQTPPVVNAPAVTPPVAQTPPGSSATTPAGVDPDEEIISGKRTPKGEDFKRVKTAASAAAKERDELKAKWEASTKELNEAKKQPVHNAELIKAIEKERDDLKGYKEKWEGVAATFDPAHRAKYDTQVAASLTALAPMLPADRADKIAAALQMPDSNFKLEKLKELTEDLDPLTVSEITAANRDIRGIRQAEKAELAKSGEILSKAAEARQQQAKEHQERVSKAFDAELARRGGKDSKDALPVYQMREGDSDEVKAWNAGVEERTKVARAIFEDKFDSPNEKADAAMFAAAAPGLLKQLNAVQSENATLKEALAKMQGTTPPITGGGNATPPPAQRGGFMQKMLAKTPM